MGKELLQGYYNNEETGGISIFSVVTDDGYLNKSICENIEEVGDNMQKDGMYLDDDLYETI